MTKTIAEQYQEQFDNAINSLYRKGDRNKPLLPEGQMEETITELKVKFSAGLLQVEQEAKEQKQAADALEARSKQDLAHFLSDAELQSYQVRQSIVAEDAKNLDTLDFLRNARAAAQSKDKVAALGHMRAMPEAKNFAEQREVDQVQALLKGVIMPPDLLDAGQRAQELRYNAEVERVAAKSALHDLVEPDAIYNPFE